MTGILFAAIAALAWTFFSFAMKTALRDASVFKAAAGVTGLNAMFVTIVALFIISPVDFVPKNTDTIFYLGLAGVFHVGLARIFFYTAIQRLGPSRAIPMAMSYPVVTAVTAAWFLGEPVTAAILGGLALLLGGIVLIVQADPARPGTEQSAAPSWRIVGWASAAITALLWGIAATFFKKAALGVHPLAVTSVSLWVGFTVSFLISRWMDPKGRVPGSSWRWLLLSAALQTIAVPFYVLAFTHTLAVRVTAIVSIQPFLAIPIGWLIMREAENITPRLAIGATLIVGGTILVIL
jgi:drug/metabolite transporter (DMT)-like permease